MIKNYKKYSSTILIFLFLAAFIYGVSLWNDSAGDEAALYWGASGEKVTEVQRQLKQWGYHNGAIDGVYGGETMQAVKKFQENNGITPDGIIREDTWSALGHNTVDAEPVQAGTEERGGVRDTHNTQLLARVISGEARGEPYTGKVAVGAVIMNRVESSSFPNTLSGVVYQSLAFESVANGQYATGVDQESLKAARQVMTGWDPTNGALYFWNPAKRVNPWIWSRNVTMQIGKHVFGI